MVGLRAMPTPGAHDRLAADSTREVTRMLFGSLVVVILFGSVACAPGTSRPLVSLRGSVSAAPPADASSATLNAVPGWALADPSRGAEAEIGIGSGPSLDAATRYALQDVASRLSVSVESELKDTIVEDGRDSVERLEQVIQTRVTGTRFAGWKRTRTEERLGVFWVEVRIDRRQLAEDSMQELTRLADDIDLRLESGAGSALRRLITLQNTATDRERAGDLISLLAVIDLDFDRAAWESRRRNWRQIDEAARRALIFEVRADRDSKEVARWVESRLVADRLQTRAGGCRSPEAICIDIRSEVTEAAVASRHIAKIRSVLELREPSGAIVRERNLEGRGASKSDRARARRRALDDLREVVSSFSVLDGLTER